MVHFGISHGCYDRISFHGRLSAAHAYLLYIKESNDMGISLMDEDFIHEGLAQEAWV